MGFGDVGVDGDLDVVFGNFGYGSIGIIKILDEMEGIGRPGDQRPYTESGE